MTRAKLQLRSAQAAKAERAPDVIVSMEDKEGKGTVTATARPDRQGKRLIAGHFPKATWAMLRDLGTRLDKNNQELLQEALEDLFAKHRQR